MDSEAKQAMQQADRALAGDAAGIPVSNCRHFLEYGTEHNWACPEMDCHG